MLIDQLNRISEFAEITPSEMRALAAHAQVLCIPPGRWLAQPGRELSGYFYLLKGAIETFGPRARIKSSGRAALSHFYPGCAGVRTLSASQVLRIDPTHFDFLMTRYALAASNMERIPDWLDRFLTSPMMNRLEVARWREVMNAFVPTEYPPGAPMLVRGDAADCCFVLESGHAVVHRDGTTLSHLSPGDFFGEDALILGGCRTASVTSLDRVRVQRIDRTAFESLLLNELVQFVRCHSRFNGMVLNIGRGRVPGAVPVSLPHMREQLADFDPRLDYLVVGGDPCERSLCAFLLVQRGMRAHPVA
jgi:CRP-like cAMP-binding protein